MIAGAHNLGPRLTSTAAATLDFEFNLTGATNVFNVWYTTYTPPIIDPIADLLREWKARAKYALSRAHPPLLRPKNVEKRSIRPRNSRIWPWIRRFTLSPPNFRLIGTHSLKGGPNLGLLFCFRPKIRCFLDNPSPRSLSSLVRATVVVGLDGESCATAASLNV